jgi:uncharacterized protein (TIGR00290 family)
MAYALMTSGGKDAVLALDRARRAGREISLLVSLYDGTTSRVRFHELRKQLLELQADALGIESLTVPVPPGGYEPVFNDALRNLRARGLTGIIFGNISLADVRAWYEERVVAAGLEHIEPLWGDPAVEIAWEVVERGFRAIVVSVNLAEGATRFLGREFDADLVTQMSVIDHLDPAGERGEYHTFVFDGPDFAHAVGFTRGQEVEHDGHRYLDLLPPNGSLATTGT